MTVKSSGRDALRPLAVVLYAPTTFRDNEPMSLTRTLDEPSPAPWVFAEHIYGLPHCLVDRDGRVIASHFPISNGPLLEQAPAMAQILRELVAGVPATLLQGGAAQVLDRIDSCRARQPGEDDE